MSVVSVAEQMFYFLIPMLLVGSVFGQDSGEIFQNDCEEVGTESALNLNFDDPNKLQTSSLSDCNLNECHNVTDTDVIIDRKCPGDEKCSYRFFRCCQSFQSAQHTCRCIRGNLTSIHNQCTNHHIKQFVNQQCVNVGLVWIGVWKPNQCNGYQNVDGSCLNYTNWACGHPQRHGRKCTALNVKNGRWYTLNCCRRLPFVCAV
ncbi:bone marrow proteoglycan-like [Spea bombifrons]|uniref:bone marrow proteoglycan-like n=1 Tax=Spea bombifrons TaxID=233779 RepID=UPI00234B3D82|nr:bone marrow proteoglycan-like [Spea bombifrons]